MMQIEEMLGETNQIKILFILVAQKHAMNCNVVSGKSVKKDVGHYFVEISHMSLGKSRTSKTCK